MSAQRAAAAACSASPMPCSRWRSQRTPAALGQPRTAASVWALWVANWP
jgi:hypothetical protein